MSTSSPVHPAPGRLEFVRQFVNTLDLEAGVDRLADRAGWREWATEQGVATDLTSAELADLRTLREALREGLSANHERAPLPAVTIAALDLAAARARLALSFTPDGLDLAPVGGGVESFYGRVVSVVAASLGDGTWGRLKACASDRCRWGFYDTSRSRTGQWCSMSICGNRAKQTRWRQG